MEAEPLQSEANQATGAQIGRQFSPQTGLVDPATANKGGANEGIVKENIKQSVEAFEDDDSDGITD